MKIRIDDLKDKTVELVDEEPVAGYPSLVAMEQAGECSFPAPLRIRLAVAREYDHIRVTGRVETELGLTCSRCLAEYRTEVDAPFTIFYLRATGMDQDEEVELAEEDMISATYAGDEIDFTAEIAEQITMAIPFKPLCRVECRGLCQICGADLNASACACGRQEINVKFSALKDFKVEK